MFTSRSEFRLTLRAENSDMRLTPLGLELGIINDRQKEVFFKKKELMAKANDFMLSYAMTS
jgi:tRNA uridine 5-carboxymethylaminomethyl modification enzyme